MSRENGLIVPQEVLESRLGFIRDYISDNSIKGEPGDVTPEEFDRMPYFESGCSKLQKGNCPYLDDLNFNYKPCHRCAYARNTLNDLKEVSDWYGFKAGSIEELPKTQRLCLALVHREKGDLISVIIRGDENGKIAIFDTQPRMKKRQR